MRLLLISDVTMPGGVDTQLDGLCVAAKQAGHDVEILLEQHPGANTTADKLGRHGFAIHRGALHHKVHCATSQAITIDRALHNLQPEVVHVACGMVLSCITAREHVIEHRVPLIFTENYVASGQPLEESERRRVSAIYESCFASICVCEENRSLLHSEYGLDTCRTLVVKNAVEVGRQTSRVTTRQDGKLRIITPARLTHQKGIDVLIHAAAALPRHFQENVEIHVYGDGELRDELEDLAHQLDVARIIVFHGWVANVSELFAVFDLMVLPSRSEGLPYVLLEAMAAGVPIIATDVSGVPDALAQGACGDLVNSCNSVALKSAIQAFFENRAELQLKAVFAKSHIEKNHDLRKWIEWHQKLWDRATASTHKTAGN